MDREAVRAEADEWVREGIITAEQAQEIVARYENSAEGTGSDSDTDTDSEAADDNADAETSPSRLIVALSLMGTALVAVGTLLFTLESALPTALQVTVSLAIPVVLGTVSLRAARDTTSHLARGLWLLAALFVGGTLGALDSLEVLALADGELLALWAAVVLPAGHLRPSTSTVSLGVVLAGGAAFTLIETFWPALAVGVIGLYAVAGGRWLRLQNPETNGDHQSFRSLSSAYTNAGTGLVLLSSLLALHVPRETLRPTLEPTGTLLVTVVLAMGVCGWLWVTDTQGDRRLEGYWAVGTVVALSVALLATTPHSLLGAVGATVAVHLLALFVLLLTVAVALTWRSRMLINLCAITFFLQVVLFLVSTALDILTGSLALVLIGGSLLAIAVGLERGRRTLLARMG